MKPDNIILCNELMGDCFYNFYPIDFTDYKNRDSIRMRLIPYKFGAYAIAAKKLEGFTTKDYGLLLGGQEVEVMVKLHKEHHATPATYPPDRYGIGWLFFSPQIHFMQKIKTFHIN